MFRWLGRLTVACRSSDREIAGLIPSRFIAS